MLCGAKDGFLRIITQLLKKNKNTQTFLRIVFLYNWVMTS